MDYINIVQKNNVDYAIQDARINITSNDIGKVFCVKPDLSVEFIDVELPMEVDTSGTTTFSLARKQFRFGTVSSLTISDAADYTLDFKCVVSFTTDTGFTLDVSGITASIEWFGDDLSNGTPDLSIGKRYDIYFYNNSAISTPSIRAIIIGA